MVEIVKTDEGDEWANGHIVRDGEVVGVICWGGNRLKDIDVFSEYRNEGIATEAISELLSLMEDQGFDVVRTTAIVSSAMERVLDKNGFDLIVTDEDLETGTSFSSERLVGVYEF